MTRRVFLLTIGLLVLGLIPWARAEDTAKFTLRYRFQAGDTLRWNVVHRCQIRTSVSGTMQTAETTTTSVKAWRVHEVLPDGTVTFEHVVENVDMRHRLTGRDEVHYNSRTDLHPPPGFETVAQAVGLPLCVIKMDAKGRVIRRTVSARLAPASGWQRTR